ncbi:MAG: hypothetical protein Kow00106_20410 [Anaerolineae bacterium]
MAAFVSAYSALAARPFLLWSTAILAVYLAVRFCLAALAWARGSWLIRQWERRDWRADYLRRSDTQSLTWQDVHHLVIVPNVTESETLLRRSLDRLAAWPDAPRAMTVVLAMEGGDPFAADRAAHLQEGYASRFRHVLVTHHPVGLPGEVPGKSANLAWAIRQARQRLVDQYGYSPDQVVVTVMDADTLWHPAYFDCLTTLFATAPDRHTTFWQAPIRYHGNVWTAHWLMRPLHAQAGAWELAYLAAPWWQALPMSSYSLSLRLLDESGGWATDAIADEWHMFLRSYGAHKGCVRLQPVFLPFLVHIVSGTSTLATVRARYWQTVRHAWGAEEIGHALASAINGPWTRGLRLAVRVAHDHLMAGAGAVLLGLGTQLPPLIDPNGWRAHLLSAPIVLLQLSLLTIALISALLWWGDGRSRPAPEGRGRPSLWREVPALLLLPLLTALCLTLPVLHAQTLLMSGRRPRFETAAKE